MADRADTLRIEDMQRAVERILAYTEGATFESFADDERTVDAVLRNLAVLGEAAARVTDETRALAPDIEWGALSARGTSSCTTTSASTWRSSGAFSPFTCRRCDASFGLRWTGSR